VSQSTGHMLNELRMYHRDIPKTGKNRLFFVFLHLCAWPSHGIKSVNQLAPCRDDSHANSLAFGVGMQSKHVLRHACGGALCSVPFDSIFKFFEMVCVRGEEEERAGQWDGQRMWGKGERRTWESHPPTRVQRCTVGAQDV
jgi:hypothetical protein